MKRKVKKSIRAKSMLNKLKINFYEEDGFIYFEATKTQFSMLRWNRLWG